MDCLSFCFGKSREREDSERDPLLPKPKHNESRQAINGASRDGPTSTAPSALDKAVDVITAIKAGKLPSQSQLDTLLQSFLASGFLQDEGGPTMAGNGPMSKHGRQVLVDVRNMVQALLEFGLEKNADDKIQDTYFQLLQLPQYSEPLKDIVPDNTSPENRQNSAEDTPWDQQIAFDAQTFMFDLRTLLGRTFSSSALRILMLECIAIVNELMEMAAKDVKHAADRVHKAAEDMETRARGDHNVIDESISKGESSTEDLKQKGKSIVGTTQDVIKDLNNDLGGKVEDATNDVRERLLSRIRQVLSRLQKDPASRSAMKSLLTLFQKYASSINTMSAESKSSTEQMASQVDDTPEGTTRPTYPPAPYGLHSQGKNPASSPSETLLANIKDILERLAQRHSLDPLLGALRLVLRDLHEDVPKAMKIELTETIEQRTEQLNPEKFGNTLTPIQTQLPFHNQIKGKGKSRKASRKARKRSQKLELERSEPVTPISPSDSQNGALPDESQNPLSSSDKEPREPNVISLYFVRVGDYINKALEEPDWATGGEGARSLEALFDDGVYLINVVGESVVEVGEKVATDATSSDNEQSQGTSSADAQDMDRQTTEKENERIRRQFKAHLQTLAKEAELFITALQTDKTTMKVWNAWQALGKDGQNLVKAGGKKAYGYMHSLSPWTEWIGWAVPRLLTLLPLGAIPIPTVEFKTPHLEGALHALFVQGMARGEGNVGQGSLIPDEVVVREYTEFKFNMVDRPLHSSLPMSEVPPGTLHKPNLDTTARLHIHADGIRAKIERVGYYLKYSGSVFGYEDEGVLTADLAIDCPHEGFGIDVELEINDSTLTKSATPSVPKIVVEGEDGAVDNNPPPTIVAEDLIRGPPSPLFNVIDVNVMLRGLKVSIDDSKHWILNKMFFQPVSGPAIATALQSVLEQQIHEKLQSLSSSLGEIVREASKRSESRKLTNHERGRKGRNGFMNVMGDFWGAIVEVGPHAFGYDDKQRGQQTESTLARTSRGLVYTSKEQVVTTQPQGTSSMEVGSSTGSKSTGSGGEESIVAIGLGGQLFPDKVDATASYGATEDRERDPLGKMIGAGVNEAQNTAGHLGDRWVESSERENDTGVKTWRSEAFGLDQ